MAIWSSEKIGPAPRLAVDHAGRGELVLFLHGIGGNRSNWHDQLSAFAEHFHAAAWDARGYGDSDDYEGPLHFTQLADDILRVLDHFGAAKVHLVGLSMGGRIAQDFAIRHAARLGALVLCDTSRGLAHYSEEKRRDFVRLRKEPLVNGQEPRDMAPALVRSLIGSKASDAVFQRYVDSVSRVHKESYIKTIEASVAAGSHGTLSEIRAPTLVLVGEDDRLTPPAEARAVAAEIAGACLVILPEAGHLANLEKPAEFNAAVLDFLREVTGRAG